MLPPLLDTEGRVGSAIEPLQMLVRRDLTEACMQSPAPTILLYAHRQMESRVAAILVRVVHAVARAHAESGAASREAQDAW